MKRAIHRYSREILTLATLAAVITVLVQIVAHREAIFSTVFSETGFIYICFLAASIDLGLVIKIHYRMLVIRYHEKDTRIRLFQD
jgi:small basic protein